MASSLPKSVSASSPFLIRRATNHVSHIDLVSFKVLVIILACLAATASISRLWLRLRQERRLLFEDWLILLATMTLVAETGCIFYACPMLYTIDSVNLNLHGLLEVTPHDIDQVVTAGSAWVDAYLTLAWLSVFSVKFSFLTLFHRMIRGVNKSLTRFYWFTVITTAISGIFIIAESFFACPHFGAASMKCFKGLKYTFSLKTGIVCQCLDIVTDLMIVSIPILLLRMAQLRVDHKIRMAAVLCLSCTCIILSAARLIGGIHVNINKVLQISTVWMSFMLHCEAAVAVMTGSVPALRAIYRTHQKRRTMHISSQQLKDFGTGGGSESQPSQFKDRITPPARALARFSRDMPKRSASCIRDSLSNFQLPPLVELRYNSQSPSDDQPHSRSASVSSVTSAPDPTQMPEEPLSNEIRVTYECTVVSEEASLHDLPDFSEVGRQEWIWSDGPAEVEASASNALGTFAGYDKLVAIDPYLLGKINGGMSM